MVDREIKLATDDFIAAAVYLGKWHRRMCLLGVEGARKVATIEGGAGGMLSNLATGLSGRRGTRRGIMFHAAGAWRRLQVSGANCAKKQFRSKELELWKGEIENANRGR